MVYDNQLNEADDSDATTDIGGGSIVIHDGKNKESAARKGAETLLIEESFKSFNAYPNPLSSKDLWLELPAMEQAGDVEAYIYDVSGIVLAKKALKVEKEGGEYLWSIDHERWPGGIYLLMIKGDKFTLQTRLMKYE